MCTKAGDQPRHKKLTALKEAVFHSHGNSDPHDPPDNSRDGSPDESSFDAQRKLPGFRITHTRMTAAVIRDSSVGDSGPATSR